MRDATIKGQRGEVFLREGAPGELILSWYPSSQNDPIWPGLIMDSDQMRGFPTDAALAEDFATVEKWINEQPWAKPLPADGQSIEGDPANRDACPVCGTYVPSFAAHGIGMVGPDLKLPEANQQEEHCPACGARLFRTVGGAVARCCAARLLRLAPSQKQPPVARAVVAQLAKRVVHLIAGHRAVLPAGHARVQGALPPGSAAWTTPTGGGGGGGVSHAVTTDVTPAVTRGGSACRLRSAPPRLALGCDFAIGPDPLGRGVAVEESDDLVALARFAPEARVDETVNDLLSLVARAYVRAGVQSMRGEVSVSEVTG